MAAASRSSASPRVSCPPIGPNVHNQPPGGTFTVDGEVIPPGDNDIVG